MRYVSEYIREDLTELHWIGQHSLIQYHYSVPLFTCSKVSVFVTRVVKYSNVPRVVEFSNVSLVVEYYMLYLVSINRTTKHDNVFQIREDIQTQLSEIKCYYDQAKAVPGYISV